MAYRATIQFQCWKQHCCVGCGSVFRYRLSRQGQGQGSTSDAASAAAQKAGVKAITEEVDQRACPRCGVVQPDMLGAARASRHGRLTLVALAGLVVVLGLGMGEAIAMGTAAAAGALLAAVLAVLHWRSAAANPNTSLADNLARAQKDLAQGTLVLDEEGAAGAGGPRAVPGSEGLSPWQWAAVGLVAAGAFGIGSSEVLRGFRGWPVNAGWYPPVVGPGDHSRCDFPASISSIKGYWRGLAKVHVDNAAELGVADSQFSAMANADSWGGSISAKSSEKNSSRTLWTRIGFPADARLEGKTVRLKMELAATFPAASGSIFSNVDKRFSHAAAVQLASVKAGAAYEAAWWSGGLLGTLLSVAGGFWLRILASRLKRAAHPTRILPLQPGG